jgi:hypothetical protein
LTALLVAFTVWAAKRLTNMNKSIGIIARVIVALTLITLMATTACKRFHPGNSHGRTLPVGIYTTTTGCDVDYPQVNLVKNLYRVLWQSVDGKAYTVLFRQPDGTSGSGTPFKDSNGNPIYSFPVDPTNGIRSPPPYQTGYFEYSVNDQLNHECKSAKDPGVIVKD